MKSGRDGFGCAVGALLAITLGAGALPAVQEDAVVLTRSYMQLLLARQMTTQIVALNDGVPEADRGQIKAAADRWYGDQTGRIRADLNGAFGAEAEARIKEYVSLLTASEQAGDRRFLTRCAAAFQLQPEPADYAQLRQQLLDGPLRADLENVSRFMSEVQTWTDLRSRQEDAPALRDWLDRNQKPVSVEGAGLPAGRRRQPLADAEAELAPMDSDVADDMDTPLDVFETQREEKRKQALDNAHAGMQQVAAERSAAEQEFAARKMAAAQAESAALKQHAEKLAAVEAEALEQRQKSWGNRLKGLLGATVSAASGAFFGGVGAHAGQEAVNAIFN